MTADYAVSAWLASAAAVTNKRRFAVAALALLTVLQLLLAVASLRDDSATADEGAHIAAGWLKLVYGRLDFFREQPPLMNSLTALPLVLAGYDFPLPPFGRDDHWAVGRDYLFRSGYDSQRILILARVPTVILFAALAWAVYFFVRAESGDSAWAIAAFALTAFCPILLAHGRLATVDMAATFFCFSAAVLLMRMVRAPTLTKGVLCGAATAAAILSKTSSLVLLPFGAIMITLAFVSRQVSQPKRFAGSLVAAAAGAIVIAELVVVGLASNASIARQFPHIDSAIEHLMLPFLDIAANVRVIRSWYSGSRFAAQFLLGDFSEGSWWYYYPVALLLKMTIPSLVISVAGMALLVRSRATFGAVCSLIFVALFLAAAASGDLALGVRYVLPVLPFLYAAVAIVLSKNAGRKTTIATALLVAWHVGESVAAYPSYIGYFNQTIGSHRNADRYLIDSNLDWGQDLRRLDRWCRENGVKKIAVCYFGGGDVEQDMSVDAMWIWSVRNPEVPPRNHFAISRHLYRLSSWRRVSRESWREYLEKRGARYVTTVGDSIVVYRMDAGEMSTVNR